jgi:hypothetical protein
MKKLLFFLLFISALHLLGHTKIFMLYVYNLKILCIFTLQIEKFLL